MPLLTKPPKKPSDYNSSAKTPTEKSRKAYKNELAAFRAHYPQYDQSSSLDFLRKTEFSRLEKFNEVYVDYMGGCLWPECLVAAHLSLLRDGLFGNTHSDSPSATRSDFHIAAARNAALEYFDAPAEDYVCIFTANTTTALKLVGESFPFRDGSSLIIPSDCHNSVNGLRRFAEHAGAKVTYLESTEYGGFYEEDALKAMEKHDPRPGSVQLDLAMALGWYSGKNKASLPLPCSIKSLTISSATYADPNSVPQEFSESSGERVRLSVESLKVNSPFFLSAPSWADGWPKLATPEVSTSDRPASLFILTGQSNITGIRPSTDILASAKSHGYSTLIDAAALASCARISLRSQPATDAIVVSFYKMFGYPTGVGALIAKKEFIRKLERRWFSGGSVDFVQAPGSFTLHAKDLTARFEEGTLNYGALSAIAPGLELLRTFIPAMSLRLPALHRYLHTALESLVYPGRNAHLVKVHTKLRLLTMRRSTSTKSMGSDTQDSSSGSENGSVYNSTSFFAAPVAPKQAGQGYVVSCTFYTSDGIIIPLTDVSRLAGASGISLRTGCVCNPGGAAALRGKDVQDKMEELSNFDESAEVSEVHTLFGGESSTGIVRLSLGMASNFEDVWRVVQWAQGMLDENKRMKDLERLAVGNAAASHHSPAVVSPVEPTDGHTSSYRVDRSGPGVPALLDWTAHF